MIIWAVFQCILTTGQCYHYPHTITPYFESARACQRAMPAQQVGSVRTIEYRCMSRKIETWR